MFSGLTNQVSSLFSKNADEQVPTPPQSATGEGEQAPIPSTDAVAGDNAENPEKQSQASGGMFSNVTGKVSGWLPSNLPSVSMPSVSMPTVSMPSMPAMPSIPGLRKTQTTDETAAAESATETAIEAQPSQVEKDEDDRSSATGGADSGPASEKGTPTEEAAPGAVGNVMHKVSAGSKAFGSFFSGVVNKAGDLGGKIKDTVKHNPILGEFSKEQEAFIKFQSGKNTEPGVCPWIGHKYEEKIKEEVLSLSSDRRNFVRAPPAGCDFEFNYDSSYPVATALMAEDPALEKMRFDLVPKIITEENFWKNYFYRVSLIVQAGDLGTLGTSDAFGKQEEEDDVSTPAPTKDIKTLKDKHDEISSNDDKFKAKTNDEKHTTEVQEKMKRLNVTNDVKKDESDVIKQQSSTSGIGDEEEWEKNLAAEDFEVVGDDQNVDSDLDDLK